MERVFGGRDHKNSNVHVYHFNKGVKIQTISVIVVSPYNARHSKGKSTVFILKATRLLITQS